jgi:hypothetical protein
VPLCSSALCLTQIVFAVVFLKILGLEFLNSARVHGIKELLKSDFIIFHCRPHRLEVLIYRPHHLPDARYGLIWFSNFCCKFCSMMVLLAKLVMVEFLTIVSLNVNPIITFLFQLDYPCFENFLVSDQLCHLNV